MSNSAEHQPPGIPKLTFRVWVLLGGVLIGQGIVHGTTLIPLFIGSELYLPDITDFLVFAALGWIVLHAVDTLLIFIHNDLDALSEFFDQIELTSSFLLLMAAYINSVVFIAGGLGWVIGAYLNLPIVGLVVAMLFPNLDLRYARQVPTPGRILLKAYLAIFQVLGQFKEATPEEILDRLQRPGGSLRNPNALS